MSNQAWDNIYSLGQSSRYRNEGDIGIYYRLPKFIEMFSEQFPAVETFNILEIGSGLGEVYDLFAEKYKGQSYRYILTEYSDNAVRVLKNKYKDQGIIFQADATNLSFEDNQFDMVCSFDVMHHVDDAEKMAKEILRVTKRFFFLCEPNGLSVIRRIGELSVESKNLGEKSYLPWEYKKFFINNGASNIQVVPFYFFVPPKVKKENMKYFIAISEFGQKIPILKWQSQSLAIFGEK